MQKRVPFSFVFVNSAKVHYKCSMNKAPVPTPCTQGPEIEKPVSPPPASQMSGLFPGSLFHREQGSRKLGTCRHSQKPGEETRPHLSQALPHPWFHIATQAALVRGWLGTVAEVAPEDKNSPPSDRARVPSLEAAILRWTWRQITEAL